MASSLEELLAEEGFKGSRRRSVTKSRSSFHYGAPSEPLHSMEDRLCKSSERIKTQRTKSDSAASRFQIGSAKNRLKNDEQTEKKSCSITGSGKGSDSNSSEYMPMPRYERVLENVYSDQVSNGKRGKEKYFNELVEKPVKDSNMLRQTSGNRKNSYTRSKSESLEEDSRNNKNSHQSASDSGLALDEVAVQALVSILNGYIKRFLKDEEFQSSMRHNCFSSLNFIQVEEENNNTETKVITSLEQAIETIEHAAEEPISATYLKRATMQLSIIAGLSLNDLKYGYTCGIPNYKLSACAHLYLSVVYMIQRKNKVSAKHLLQVFCDSPFQARTILLPELWEHLFSPHLSHLKAWYNQKEAEILVDTPSKTRRLKLLQKVYNEHLDSGTHIFAVYYKDWLTEGAESPTIPSIGIPSLSVSSTTSRRGSSLGHSSESASSSEPFSPQPMVSKKLYDSVFGSSNKPGVCEDEDSKDEDSLESCVRGSYGSTIVKQTLIYESETIKFTDQNTEDFTPTVPVGAFHPKKRTPMTAAEEWQERNRSNATKKSFSTETNLNNHIVDALPHEKANELSLRKPNKISSTHEVAGSYFQSVPQEFICPLTRNIFEEPVTLETGQTFEREAIKAWFAKGNRTCPVTGNTLECVAMPFTNLILKRLINNWKSENLDHLLDFASQTVENSKLKKRDEAAVFKLEGLFSSLKQEYKST